MSFEPHSDDVLSVATPGLTPVNHQTLRVSQLIQGFKSLQSSAFQSWYDDGIECEFLSVTGGTGWQTGKMRIRFEFVPDVPDEPELVPELSFLEADLLPEPQ